MNIASIQLGLPEKGANKRDTVTRALAMMDGCAGADLVVLPELWNIGFFDFDAYETESEALDGPTAVAIAAKARELGAYVHAGSFVEKRGGAWFNTSLLFDREGNRIAEYRKLHLFSYASREADILSPGNDVVVVPTEFGRVGLSTCYDLRFPELYRKMADMGAHIFLVVACWPFPRLAAWETLVKARALENVACLVACNASGSQAGVQALGNSRVVDPYGVPVAACGFEETILKTRVDPGMVGRAREAFPVLDDRRQF